MATDDTVEATTIEHVPVSGTVETTNEPVIDEPAVATEADETPWTSSAEAVGTEDAEGDPVAKPAVTPSPVSNLSDEDEGFENPPTDPVPVDSSAFITKQQAESKGWKFIHNDKHSAHVKVDSNGTLLVRPWSYAGDDFEADDEESAFAQMP